MRGALLVASLVLAAAPALAAAPVHHDLEVTLEPAAHALAVRDRVSFAAPAPAEFTFTLHPGLGPRVEEPGARLEETGESGGDPRYRLTLPAGAASATLVYGGAIDHPLEQVGEEYARGQRETRGTISDGGVFLAGSSGWYPAAEGGGTLTFTLAVDLPDGWDAVSQGARPLHESAAGRRRVRWECAVPQDAIALVADRYTEYRGRAGGVETLVFLRAPDAALAAQYLDAAGGYLAMYSSLIGPYPYGTWSTVENFWETGYGMPSFTLLGPKVIRFPFILHTSFPHEILHSWWGNGVFPAEAGGNWTEGLTAYLADHLDKEQRGEGAEHRRTTLAKYADFVLAGRDLPLADFRSRHGSVSEAVGYGKGQMLFHMLRLELGDAAFVAGLRAFWEQRRFSIAGFDDLRRAFEGAAGRDLGWFFEQWVGRAGAPLVRLAQVRAGADGRSLAVTVEQAQEGAPYRLRVPVAVTVEGAAQAIVATVELAGRTGQASFGNLPGAPLRVDVDPEFDLFRRLDAAETPPAFSRAFGAERALVLLPSAAPAPLAEGYRTLAGLLERSGPAGAETREDRDFAALPPDRSVFALGWENRFLPEVRIAAAALGAEVGDRAARFEQVPLAGAGHAFALVARHPANAGLTLSWAAIDDPAAAEGLGRKLPHYGKYGFLAFEGAEPANVAKGRWPAVGSPLTRVLAGSATQPPAAGRPAPRSPLAALPPRFSRERMLDDVRALADPALAGRGFGSPGAERAADMIAAAFAGAGLLPGGDDGTWFQSFAATGGSPPREARLRNVVGVLRGTEAGLERPLLVIGAHYDHLGEGDPGCLPDNRGKVHPGADDNASGVAVLLELARTLWKDAPPARTVVFAAFAGEEQGRLGSAHFVGRPAWAPGRIFAMLNLDTVGRLEGRKVLVLDGASAREWVHIFRGAGYLAGVETALAAEDLDASDDVTFRRAGVPAVQVFAGPNLCYHRPDDAAEVIDADGLAKVAALTAEVAGHLAGAQARLTAPEAKPSAAAPRAAPEGERKVSLGVVPDFAWKGAGVRLEGVAPGSPAEAAGLRAGDVLLAVGETRLDGLRALSALLKTLAPGKVALRYARDGLETAVEADLVAR